MEFTRTPAAFASVIWSGLLWEELFPLGRNRLVRLLVGKVEIRETFQVECEE